MNLDYEIFSKVNGLAGHFSYLDLAMVLVAKWGVVVYGIALLSIWFKKAGHGQMMKNRKAALRVVLGAVIAFGINQLIGLLYFRPRPFAAHNVTLLLSHSPDSSFPSDHATGATAVTAGTFWENKTWGTILTVLSLVLFIARIYCGVHYPLDIIGGIFTGLAGSYFANKLWPYVDGLAGKLIGIWDNLVNMFAGI